MRQLTKNILIAFILFVTQSGLLLAGNEIQSNKRSLKNISKGGITIAFNNNDAPFSFLLTNGKPAGLYIDIWKRWSEINKIQIEFVGGSHQESIDSLRDGLADLHAGLFKSESRATWASFSAPIAKINSNLFFNGDTLDFPTLNQLDGKTIAVGKDTFQANYLRQEFPNIQLSEFVDGGDITDLLLSNKIQAIFAETPFMQSHLGRLGLVGVIVASQETVLANKVHGLVLKDNIDLMNIVNSGLSQIPIVDLRNIERKWLSREGSFFTNTKVSMANLSNKEINWLINNDKFSLGISPNLTPIEWLDEDNKYKGVSADFVKIISTNLDVDMVPIKDVTWNEIIEKIKLGEVDILPTVVRTKSRDNYINFTKPYVSFPLVIASSKKSDFIQGLDDLVGRVVGVEESSSSEETLRNNHPELNVTSVGTVYEGLEWLKEGKIDAFVHGLAPITYQLNTGDFENLKIAAFTPYKVDISMGVRKGLEPLIPILNKALSNITEREKNQIMNSWLSVKVNFGTQLVTVLYWALPILLLLFLIIFWVYRSNRMLQREIKNRMVVEEYLKLAKQQAETANRAKDDFLANMSHEIRTPMNAILGFSQILSDSQLNEEQEAHNQLLQGSAKSLLILVDDILDLSKVEAGQIEIEIRKVETKIFFRKFNKSIQILTNDKDITFEIIIADEVPSNFLSDGYRLTQILLNLVNNSIKFSSHGAIVLSMRVKSQSKDGYLFEFCVSDDGIGMNQSQIERLFKTYSQADSSTTRQYGGTGLGLAISKNLCQLMGGDIWVTSQLKQGSQFYFTISASKVNQDNERVDSSKYLDIKSADIDIEEIRRNILKAELTALLVDDNEINLIVAKNLLIKSGISVEIAVNGKEAVAKVSEKSFDFVLMDIRMPVMNGYEATRAIRNQLKLESLPIIALSANVMEGDRQKSLDSGMNAHLGKPIDNELLLRVIWENINRSS
ncbi:MAG: hypothetical protein COB38_07640 [Gammaproteobacteria bacterium]|nr:MAG: hypothetical protein COB38_07640 [Gammaproteobacteria bacterium]